jgi:hypothetical protein
MDPITSLKTLAEAIAGFPVIQVAVRSNLAISLLLREDYTQWTDYQSDTGISPSYSALDERLVTIFLDELDDWGWVTFSGWGGSTIGTSTVPDEKFIMMSGGGLIYSTGSGTADHEDKFPYSDDARRGGIRRIRNILGHAYVCSGNRGLGVRRGVNNWEWLSSVFRYPMTGENGLREDTGFEDVDGFSLNDIYLVGGQGDVWHFDGQRATQIDFPANAGLYCVCCGGDGNVYIGGTEGRMFMGRGDRWKELRAPLQGLPMDELAWHDGRLWATNDFGIWWVKGNKVIEADIPGFARVCSGSVSAHDGLLLLGGRGGVAYHKDGEWHSLFSYFRMMSECRDAGLLDGVLRARWHEFLPKK